ncbi:MFS general substrate transporter [Macrolepiota fuliginosa MF-IS2]|uniref:MFS general substrate transporter n=1 Tax=Macrolepiota fuliginosa MF-IS2 TaxID=1400762 RepID=A0A9P5XH92_9AGAR|nr:MFS general substrate transporter [Macrolepiota fuliginosa MF-IS2]
MPIMFVIYFLQYMDKQTLSFSSVFGLIRDTNLVGNQYSILGSIVHIAQLLLQPISAFFLVKFRLSIYIPCIVTCWGITLACMSAARGFVGLLIGRFFLGAFEASIQSAFILVGQIWYRRHEQGFRVAVWYSNNGWGNIFGSLIMYGIGHIRSTVLFRYQIIFLVLGCITFLVGIVSFFIFPDNPAQCKFLSHEDKVIAVERLRANNQGLETKSFKPSQALEMLTDLKSWCWMTLMFLMAIPAGGITTFGPLILKGFGFDGFNVMLFNMPFGVLQVTAIFTAFWAAKRFRMKSPVILVALTPCITGAVLLLRLGRFHEDLPGLLTAYYLLACYSSVIPLIFNWQSTNVAGHTKKTTTTAFMTMGTVSGNIVGPLLFKPQDKPYYTRGLRAMLASFCSCFVIVCCTTLYLRNLNARNKKRRILAGKPAEIVDYSMLSAQEAEAVRAKARVCGGGETQKVDDGTGKVQEGQYAFEDMTDLQNDEFIVSVMS